MLTEERMRPYRIEDETYDDDEHSRVVPIRPGSRGRLIGTLDRGRPEPWMPRDRSLPTAPNRAEAPAPPPARPSRAHWWIVAGVAVICVGMILGVLLVRLWDEASRAVAELPPEGAAAAARQQPQPTPVPTPAIPATAPSGAPAETPERGAITTEIRVLQPNYTVAPGDTLASIARRHGTSIEALAAINNLENRNSLSVGQKLIIP